MMSEGFGALCSSRVVLELVHMRISKQRNVSKNLASRIQVREKLTRET